MNKHLNYWEFLPPDGSDEQPGWSRHANDPAPGDRRAKSKAGCCCACPRPPSPKGLATFPRRWKNRLVTTWGWGGLFYSLLWSIQKQLTEIIKSSIPEPHSSNSPSIASRSIKPSALEPLFKKKSLGKERGDGNTPLTKKKGNGLKCATEISTRTRFLMLESLLYCYC